MLAVSNEKMVIVSIDTLRLITERLGGFDFCFFFLRFHFLIHNIHNLHLTREKRLAIAILQVFHKLILRKKEICT